MMDVWIILEKLKRSRMIQSINLSLSTQCSASCIFCPSDRGKYSKQKIMPFEIAKHIIDEIADTELLGTVQKLEISENGDFLTNPFAIMILRYIRKKLPNIWINAFSNFSLMDKKTSEILLGENLINNIITNIDSSNPIHYKAIKNLDLEKSIANLRDFVTVRNDMNKSVSIQMIILSLGRYIDAVKNRLGSYPIKLQEHPERFSETSVKDDTFETQKYLLENLPLLPTDTASMSAIMLWAERKQANFKHGKCVNLYRLEKEIFINPSGEVYLCCFDSAGKIKLGNVMEKSILDIFNDPERLKLIELLKQSKFAEVGDPCNSSVCCSMA